MKAANVQTKTISEASFPEALHVEKVNESLLAQAIRVYRARLRQGNANTKTRGEVRGSTRKIYKQKGTGRARHGSIKAPVFVGGGTVHGPRSHSFDLNLPVSMKRTALAHALNSRKEVLASLQAVVDYSSGTKQAVEVLKSLVGDTKKTLIVLASADRASFRRAIENIDFVQSVPATELNALDVMSFPHIVVEDEAWAVLEERVKAAKKSTK